MIFGRFDLSSHQSENSTPLLPVHNLVVVQKLEAQHDAGSIESAGGDNANVKLVAPSQTDPIKYHTEQRDAFKGSLLRMSSHCLLKHNRQTYNQTMAAVGVLQIKYKIHKLKVQMVNVPYGNTKFQDERPLIGLCELSYQAKEKS